MKITQRFKSAINSFVKSSNSIDPDNIRSKFLRNGNSRPMVQDWSKVIMSDKDLYVGYPYAAISTRANKLSQIAIGNLKTDASKSIEEAAKKSDKEVVHPYLNIIDKSKTFSNYSFWYNISTFLDLEGVYYLMAVRNSDETRTGAIQEFKLLNPYNIKRVRDKDTGKVGGYIEAKDGLVREIPEHMIIDIRKLNPFDDDEPYAMTDAAKESQFTLKQAGDYTRHSLKNNMAAPGIISTDMLLEPEQFQNFVSRVTNQEKGVPLFGNGAGAITWDAMQIDMDKSSLDRINEINRSQLFAVSGVGKTMMGIEESGTTRETSKVQKDLFIENHIIPQLQLIIDALNQDYKVNYEKEYVKDEYELVIDNPLGSDKDVELKEIDIKTKNLELYNSLLTAGYKKEIAANYVEGEIDLDELGEPEVTKADITSTDDKKDTEKTNINPDEIKEEPILDPSKQAYLQKNGIDKFIKKYNGKLTEKELNLYIELE